MKLLTILFFVIIYSTNASIVLTPSFLAGYYPTPRIHRYGLGQTGWPTFNATVVFYFLPNITGLVAFIPADHDFPGGVGLESKSYECMQRGAIGIMAMGQVPTPQPGGLDFIWNNWDLASKVGIPVVEMGLLDSLPFLGVLATEGNFTVTITDSDPNPWYDYVYSVGDHYYFPLFWGYVSLLVLVLTIQRSYLFIKHRGFLLNTTSLFLFLEFLSNLERLLCFSTDPMFSRQIFPHLAVSILFTFTLPFTLITTLLIGFSWLELLKTIKSLSHTAPAFMQYTRIPFGIISFALIVIEVTTSSMRGLFYNISTMLTTMWSIYTIFGLLISIFFWAIGIRVLLTLSEDNSVMSKEVAQGVRTTKYLLFSGIMVTGWSIVVAICTTPLYISDPVNWTVLNNLLLIFTFGVSISQILALPTAKAKQSSHTNATPSTQKGIGTTMSTGGRDEEEV